MVISSMQIRAGRSLLNWSARELAKRAGVSLNTILRLERGEVPIEKASVGTIGSITRALEGYGVVFLADGCGVTMRQDAEKS